MELNYIREFVALAQSCQFQKTADDLYMSQSSLSKHIKTIEQELGHDLLNRSTRRVELTEFGKEWLPYATQIAAIQKEYTDRMLDGLADKKIKIGISPIITLYTLNDYLSSLTDNYPGYYAFVNQDMEENLIACLRNGDYDFVIKSRNDFSNEEGLSSIPYATDTLVTVLSEDHPLAGRESTTIDELSAYSFAQLGTTNFARILNPGLPISVFSANRGQTLMSLVKNRNVVSVLPYYAALNFIHQSGISGIITKPLVPETHLYMDIIYLKARENSTIIQGVTDYLSSHVIKRFN
ncbi:MAG: LysR family transcriptional regulator [Lachnospiraceae bacterium]|jgi:LysR family transcriptional activator of glutamate synthase operon|nr:LysR family transcriptional regulator [Lachnospiraceae bacterium]